jgi:hypothetical protein
MLVRAIANRDSALPERLRNRGYVGDYGADVPTEIGKIYVVYAIEPPRVHWRLVGMGLALSEAGVQRQLSGRSSGGP